MYGKPTDFKFVGFLHEECGILVISKICFINEEECIMPEISLFYGIRVTIIKRRQTDE